MVNIKDASQISAAAKALAALCYRHGIPMFFSAAVKNTDDGTTEYRSEYVSAAKAGVSLLDDQLSRHVNIKNGFITILPTKLDKIEID